MKDELRRRGFPEDVISEMLNDIFGKKVSSTFVEGLVDATDAVSFYKEIDRMEEVWKEKEQNNLEAKPGFFNWFCTHKIDAILSEMLKPVREEAGLGFPPTQFTTNASASLNAMIKRKVSYNKNELPAFVAHLKEIVNEQQKEMERAVIGRGKFKFRKEFSFLEVPESTWFRMSRDQREKHLKRVSQTTVGMASSTSAQQPDFVQFCITTEEFQSGLKIPLAAVKGIWQKAMLLLSDPDAISSAPGCGPESKMVISRQGKRPHLVTKGKGYRHSCDNDCPKWKSLRICSHTVAVTQRNEHLLEFCNAYHKQQRVPNITKLLLTSLPGEIDNKGNRIQRKRKQDYTDTVVPLAKARPSHSHVSGKDKWRKLKVELK